MLKMKTMGPFMATIFLLLASVSYAYSYPKLPNTENIVINVTAGTLGDAQLQESNNLQINLNISIDEEQVLVNDIPVELSGVTRFNCQALLLDSANGTTEFESGSIVSAVTRVMVNQNRLYSDSEEVVSLQVFSEVIELEGKEVQQPDMCEVKILMDPSYQKLAQYTNIYPIGHSEISRIPRENDVVVTDPTNRQKDSAEERAAWQTTSRYGGKPAVTTVEEFAAPGRLPEVPLRMLPGPEEEERTPAQSDLTRTDSQQTEPLSSYSAMCDWVVQAREHLRRFCSESLPLFFLVMWVVVIGVVGSAVIVKILDLFFPTCEHKRSYHLNNITVLPEEEKHTLLDAIEVEVAADEGEEEQRKRS